MDTTIELELRKFVAPEYVFGTDARKLAGKYVRNLGGKKVFLATDRGIMGTPWLSQVEESLEREGLEYYLFSSISPNPRNHEVMDGAGKYREHHCNVIVAVGGGSVMDCAKGIGIVSTNFKSIEYFEGVDKIERPMPPLICIPTTGGTAADVSQFAIINNTEEKYKMAIISKAVVPDAALIDPVVLTSMDPFLTACTGMDALSHAIEAYGSNASSSFTDLFAEEAIRIIWDHLVPSVKNPQDIQLRGKIMLASLYAGLAFSNASLGCVHSLAHSLGGYLDLPHGECNSILLPHVVDYNFASAEEKYSRMARILGIQSERLSSIQIKKEIIQNLLLFKKEVGIASTLKDKGVTSDLLPLLSSKAIKDPCNATNPKAPIQKDLEIIYSQAL